MATEDQLKAVHAAWRRAGGFVGIVDAACAPWANLVIVAVNDLQAALADEDLAQARVALDVLRRGLRSLHTHQWIPVGGYADDDAVGRFERCTGCGARQTIDTPRGQDVG